MMQGVKQKHVGYNSMLPWTSKHTSSVCNDACDTLNINIATYCHYLVFIEGAALLFSMTNKCVF